MNSRLGTLENIRLNQVTSDWIIDHRELQKQNYRQFSNIRRTQSQNINVSRLA